MPVTFDRVELERLANLAESLILNCHRAERQAAPSKWDEVLSAFDDLAVQIVRKSVLDGNLTSAARHLIRPESRAACAMKFLAEVETDLDADDVCELRELWKQPAIDKAASLDRALIEQERIKRANAT